MSASVDAVRALLSGAPGAERSLPPACRAEAFGIEAFGGACIAELFARHPKPLSLEPHVVETPGALAAFDADQHGDEQAIVADLYDGRIGRLWRVGPCEAVETAAEPALGFAFDPFLSQHREALALEPSDHPELEAAAAAALAEVGRSLVQSTEGLHRRALVLRAFGGGGRAAALFAVHFEPGATVRELRTVLAAATFRYASNGDLLHWRIVVDAAPPPPRLHRLTPER